MNTLVLVNPSTKLAEVFLSFPVCQEAGTWNVLSFWARDKYCIRYDISDCFMEEASSMPINLLTRNQLDWRGNRTVKALPGARTQGDSDMWSIPQWWPGLGPLATLHPWHPSAGHSCAILNPIDTSVLPGWEIYLRIIYLKWTALYFL